MRQDWGKKFPVEKLDAAKEKSVLKRLATIDVSPPLLPTDGITAHRACSRMLSVKSCT